MYKIFATLCCRPIFKSISFWGALLADGTCSFYDAEWSRRLSDVCNTWELIGPDCDPVYKVCASFNAIYTACRDTKVRKYVLPSPGDWKVDSTRLDTKNARRTRVCERRKVRLLCRSTLTFHRHARARVCVTWRGEGDDDAKWVLPCIYCLCLDAEYTLIAVAMLLNQENYRLSSIYMNLCHSHN